MESEAIQLVGLDSSLSICRDFPFDVEILDPEG